MFTLIVKRLGLAVPLLLLVSAATFLLISLSPSDVAYTLLGARATPEQLAQTRQQLGLDKPLIEQYGTWLADAVQGDLGSSLITHQSVLGAVGDRVEATLSLTLVTLAVTGAAGIALGVLGAVRGGAVARLVDAIGLLGVAVPGFLVGLILIIVFAVKMGILPFGNYTPLSDGIGPWAIGLVLPVTALAIGAVGLVAKQVRASMADALDSEFIRTLAANGFHRRSIVLKHALRSAAIPVLAVLGVTMVGLLGSSVLIEQVFGIPGIGGLTVQSTVQKDLPVVQGTAVIYTLIVVAVNILLDIVYAMVNPKVRVS